MDVLGVLLLLGVAATAAVYTVVNWRLHRRAMRRLDREACVDGTPHLWNAGFQYPPSTRPVEEECDCCLARRVVDHGDCFDAARRAQARPQEPRAERVRDPRDQPVGAASR
jgi:hypothetical protein